MTYDYDDIGNLVKDSDAEIDTVYWGVNGKMKGILRSSGSTKEGLAFDYDPSGNRIAKHVYKPGGQLAYSTYYVRDAQGNIMSTYTFTDTASTPSFAMREQHLYGSSRLGIRKDSVELSIPVNLCNSPYSLSIAGLKQYELTNHLGNVLSVISDRKLPYNSSGSGSISYFQPEIVSATDYYPFGMVMPGRSFTAGTGYRYGFNGKENDNEVKGNGNQQDYGMRVYDDRIARFFSVDPLQIKFPWYSPFQFAGNKPIWAIDLDGLEESGFTRYLDRQFSSTKGAQSLIKTSKEIAEPLTKPMALGLCKILFDEDLPKKLIDHYGNGNGEPLTLNYSEVESMNVLPLGLQTGIINEQLNDQIRGIVPGESREIKFQTISAEAATSGTFGQFTIKGEGTFTMGDGGKWSFAGTMQFFDVWNFNEETKTQEEERIRITGVSRTEAAKLQVHLANSYLPGKGFDVKGPKIPVTQNSASKFFNWFKGKSSTSKPNRDTKVYDKIKKE